MRTFRNTVIIGLAFIFIATLISACDSSSDKNRQPRSAQAVSAITESYFPLAVGNRWTYVCSTEGEQAFQKEVRIVAMTTKGDAIFFKVEQKTTDNPLVYYFSEDQQGRIFRSMNTNLQKAEIIAKRAPKIGDKLGAFTISRRESIETPATATVDALVMENFFMDSPEIPEEKKSTWRGFTFVKGIGLVVEADGLGNDCVLKDYAVSKSGK